MKIKGVNLVWNVIDYDFNSKSITSYNILNQYLLMDIQKDINRKKINNYEELKEWLDKEFKYDYWCRAECEMMVGSLYTKSIEELTKIDMYTQIKMNLDTITQLIIDKCQIKFK